MGRLITIEDLAAGEADAIVRLGARVHEQPAALASLLTGRTVCLVQPPPRDLATGVRVRAAAARLGAGVVDLAGGSAGAALPVVPGVEVVVVAGPTPSATRALGRHQRCPVVNAGAGPADPWTLLADAVALELAAAHHARGAVDGIEELRRDAMVPTLAAVLAVVTGHAGPAVTIDLRDDEPSHWFG